MPDGAGSSRAPQLPHRCRSGTLSARHRGHRRSGTRGPSGLPAAGGPRCRRVGCPIAGRAAESGPPAPVPLPVAAAESEAGTGSVHRIRPAGRAARRPAPAVRVGTSAAVAAVPPVASRFRRDRPRPIPGTPGSAAESAAWHVVVPAGRTDHGVPSRGVVGKDLDPVRDVRRHLGRDQLLQGRPVKLPGLRYAQPHRHPWSGRPRQGGAGRRRPAGVAVLADLRLDADRRGGWPPPSPCRVPRPRCWPTAAVIDSRRWASERRGSDSTAAHWPSQVRNRRAPWRRSGVRAGCRGRAGRGPVPRPGRRGTCAGSPVPGRRRGAGRSAGGAWAAQGCQHARHTFTGPVRRGCS